MANRKKMLMYVYNDINTDARVQRSIKTLIDNFNITLASIGESVNTEVYHNIILDTQGKTGVIPYLKNVFKFVFLAIREKPEVLFFNDYYGALPLLILSKVLKQCIYIYDAHELIINDIRSSYVSRDDIFYRIEKRAIKHADLVIAAQEDRALIMKEKYNLKHTPLVIENVSNLPHVPYSTPELEKFFLDERKTVVYAGVLTNSRNIAELIKAVSRRAEHCKLLIIGDGPDREMLKQMMNDEKLLYSLYIGKISYNCLGSVLERCDIGYLYYGNDTLNNRFCAPNKIYEYMSVGLALIANNNESVRKELLKYGVGCTVDNLIDGLDYCMNNLSYLKCSSKNVDVSAIEEHELRKLLSSVNCLVGK